MYVDVVIPVEVSDEHVADEPEYQRYEYAVVPPDGCAVNVEYWPLSIAVFDAVGADATNKELTPNVLVVDAEPLRLSFTVKVIWGAPNALFVCGTWNVNVAGDVAEESELAITFPLIVLVM